jgi:hypothetical protein
MLNAARAQGRPMSDRHHDGGDHPADGHPQAAENDPQHVQQEGEDGHDIPDELAAHDDLRGPHVGIEGLLCQRGC